MYNIDYEICAVFVTMILLIMCFIKKDKRNIQFYLFIAMVGLLMLSSVSDIISSYCTNHMDKFPIWLMLVPNYLYFVSKAIIAVLFCIYNIEITEKNYILGKLLKLLFFLPLFVELLALAINPFTNYLFYIDEQSGYVRGNGMWLIYAEGAFYLAFTLIYMIIYRKFVGRFRICCVELFIAAALIHIVIQYIWPTVLIEGFGESLCFMMIYFSIQKPEGLIDGNVSTYNRKAFMEKAKIYFSVKMPFNVISISVEDTDYLEKTFGMDTMNNFEVEMAKYLNIKAVKYEIFKITDYMFYLVLRERDMDNIRKFTEEICEECDKNWQVGDVEIPVVLDICVINCPEDVADMNELFACTSYFATEEHGKESRIVFVGDNEYYRGRRKSKVKLAVHKAIKNNAFQVYYQPIYSNVTKKINSAEALVRLCDDEMGFISPEEFIPIAEEDGSIIKIDEFVLDDVCRFIKENEIDKKGIKYVEVNVSVIECMKHDMAKRVAEKIEEYGLKPGQINLEITETATVNSPHMLGINMNRLVEGGVQFSLDDYGTGYSNINYLINLPFFLIKIDKNIVWSSFKNERAGIALVSSIGMIKKLGFHIVAEGIETAEQAEKLSEMGCEYLQGYYYSKPLNKENFIEFLDNIN